MRAPSGPSSGADRMVRVARDLGKTVFASLYDVASAHDH
jgi:hypothetical protein